MEITLTPELEDLVNEKVKSGKYDSPSQVVRDGLRLLKEQDQLEQLRMEELHREVMKGVEQMKNGQFITYSSAGKLVEEIIRRGKEKLAGKEKGK